MSTADATLAPESEAPAPAAEPRDGVSAFALRPEFFLDSLGCRIHVRDGMTLDVAAALREGDGVIVTDDSTISQALGECQAVLPCDVPEGALITSHQFAEPQGAAHPQEHDIPPGLPVWGSASLPQGTADAEPIVGPPEPDPVPVAVPPIPGVPVDGNPAERDSAAASKAPSGTTAKQSA